MTRPTITAFDWVPPFAQGQVRDLRVRWALEEAGQPYDVRYLNQGEQKGAAHRERQPFGQVPTLEDGDLTLFESGAIVHYVAEQYGTLLPADPPARARAIEWMFAALNSIEPYVMDLSFVTLFERDKPWSAMRRASVEERIHGRLQDLSARLGDRCWLDGDTFTAGDLLMVSVLRILIDQGLVERYDNLTAYMHRGIARPAFQKALADQMAGFTGDAPDWYAAWAERQKKNQRRDGMTYVQGFVIPVPAARKQAYVDMAAKTAPMFVELGATRIVETWGEDVAHGKTTDFYRAVAAKDGEEIVFAWIVWPDKATCDAAAERMQNDERMQPLADMPFDGSRMIYAGYEAVSDSGDGGAFGWIDGMVGAVPTAKRQGFVDHAAFMQAKLKEKGALRVVNGWGVAVPDGKATDFKRAVQAKDDETVTFGWIEWPDKATHDTGWGALMAEGIMQANPPVWDGPRAIFGGFAPIFDTAGQ